MNRCKICDKPLESKRAKTCNIKECKNAWKMMRIKNLPETTKNCKSCGKSFKTKDKRNNYCSGQCRSNAANKTKVQKYGTLSLESKESIKNRAEKQTKEKVPCKVSNCTDHARTKGYCSNHYIKYDYLKTEHGKDVYRLGKQRRRDLEDGRIIAKSELAFIREIQPQCLKCGREDQLSLDHHIPLTKGGSLELYNTTILCKYCNSEKNNKDPEDFYTSEELSKINDYFNKIRLAKSKLRKVYFLFGCFGVGKTWVTDQLSDKFYIVDYDKVRNKAVEVIHQLPTDKDVIYVSPVKVTPFINKYSMTFNLVNIALVESLETIVARVYGRSGKISEKTMANINKRYKRIESISRRYADHVGNSEEILKLLKSL